MKDKAMLGKSKHKRLAREAYDTIDADIPLALHKHVRLRGVVYDPACGAGLLLKPLALEGHTVWGTDVEPRGFGAKQDFFDVTSLPSHTNSIVSNPPYLLALKFILQARWLTEEREGMFAMLMRNEYDCAGGRRQLFAHAPFFKKIVLTWRPRWFPYKKGDNGPRHNYAWYVWDWSYQGPPLVEYAERLKGED